MNSDQIKGKAKEIGGKIQEEAGELVGSSKQQAKGLKNQAEGKIQKKVGDAREAVDDALDHGRCAVPGALVEHPHHAVVVFDSDRDDRQARRRIGTP